MKSHSTFIIEYSTLRISNAHFTAVDNWPGYYTIQQLNGIIWLKRHTLVAYGEQSDAIGLIVKAAITHNDDDYDQKMYFIHIFENET